MIKDLVLEFDTEESGFDEVVTQQINGQVEAIIVSVPYGTIDLGMYFDEMVDICLLEKYQLKGNSYIALRTDTIANDSKKFNFTQDKWVLNNKLYLLVEGNRNIKATITIRYSTI